MKLKMSFILISVLFLSCKMGYQLRYSLTHPSDNTFVPVFKNDSFEIRVYIASESFGYKANTKNIEEIKEQFKTQTINGFRLSCYVDRKNNSIYQLSKLNFVLVQQNQNLIREYPLVEHTNQTIVISYNSPDTIKKFSSDALMNGRFNVIFDGMDKSSYYLKYNADLFIDKIPRRVEGQIGLNLLVHHASTGNFH